MKIFFALLTAWLAILLFTAVRPVLLVCSVMQMLLADVVVGLKHGRSVVNFGLLLIGAGVIVSCMRDLRDQFGVGRVKFGVCGGARGF